MKPSIIFFGNCHLGVARNALGRIGSLTDRYELLYIRNDAQPADWNLEVYKALERCEVFFEQIRTDGTELRQAVHGRLPANCRKVSTAPSFLNSLWPFVAKDARNVFLPTLPEGAYPKYLGNRFILDFLERGDEPEAACRRYLDMDIARAVDLDRLHEIGLAQLGAMERGKDIQLGGFIAEQFRAQRLFLMPLHPGGPLFAELCRRMLAVLEVPDSAATVQLFDELRAFRGVGAYEAPIHPAVAKHFGLSWAESLTYKHFHEGDFDHDSFALRYARFDFSLDYYKALALLGVGRRAEAYPLLLQAVAGNPRSRYIARTFATVALDLGRLDDAMTVLDQSLSHHWPADAALWLLLARAAASAGNDSLTELAAQRAIDLGAQPEQAWAHLADSLGRQNRQDDADYASRRHLWYRSLPVQRPFVEDTGAEFGRHWLGWGHAGF